jgi:hypothetical protein
VRLLGRIRAVQRGRKQASPVLRRVHREERLKSLNKHFLIEKNQFLQ